jgi:hypothetical protein
MIISNDEPFIDFQVAAEAFFHDITWFEGVQNEHLTHLSSWLKLYLDISGVCNVYAPAKSTPNDKIDRFPKNIQGMCTVEIESFHYIKTPNYSGDHFSEVEPKIIITISPFINKPLPELVGCSIIPIQAYINHDNYLRFSFVRLSELINHAREVGIEINASFLEPIISNDPQFSELKRLSKKSLESKFNIKQAANKYLKYFDGVLEEIIIQACELASVQYDRLSEAITPVEKSTNSNIDGILKLFSDTPFSLESIEQLKNTLPNTWREALFPNPNEMIANLESSYITNNDQSDRERSNLFKTIGLLTLAFTELKGIKFGSSEKPNINQIANELGRFLPENSYGLGERTIRGRIKEGINSLKNC